MDRTVIELPDTALAIPLARQPRPLTESQRERHARTLLIQGIGEAGQERIAAARVLVVGAGGLGSPVLQYLTAAGVGTILLSDPDRLDLSNLQRQVLHGEANLGEVKSASAVARLSGLNSDVELVELPRITVEVLDALDPRPDLVVECSDTFATKYLVGDWCQASGVPLVLGTIVAGDWQVAAFWSQAPTPWPRVGWRDLHGAPPPPGSVPGSTEIGVFAPAVGQCASTMSAEAIKLLAGVGRPLLGRVAVGNAFRPAMQVLDHARPRVDAPRVDAPQVEAPQEGGRS